MDYIEGQNLNDYVRDNSICELPFASQVVRRIARGLDYMHAKGTVHYGVKPSGVMIAAGPTVTVNNSRLARLRIAC
jgi:serine/threonine protein kinase